MTLKMKNAMQGGLILGLFLTMASLTGCVRYAIDTPNTMVELEQANWSNYDLRATSAEGVVLAVRTLRASEEGGDIPVGDLVFWSEATQLRMRTRGGYALLDEIEVRSADGTPGVQLQFGRDQEDEPYVYWVTLYVTSHFLHVVEAGGRQDLFEASQSDIENALASYECLR